MKILVFLTPIDILIDCLYCASGNRQIIVAKQYSIKSTYLKPYAYSEEGSKVLSGDFSLIEICWKPIQKFARILVYSSISSSPINKILRFSQLTCWYRFNARSILIGFVQLTQLILGRKTDREIFSFNRRWWNF